MSTPRDKEFRNPSSAASADYIGTEPGGGNNTSSMFGSDADSLGVPALPDAPSPPSVRALLLTVNSFGSRIPRAARAGLAILIPGVIGLLLGYGTEVLLVSGGAVCVINGENRPYRERWKSMLRYTLLFTALTLGFRSLGIWAQSHGAIDFSAGLSGVIDNPQGTLVAYSVLMIFLFVCVACVYVHMSLQLTPPGPYLMLFVTGGLLVNKIPISLAATATWSLIGAAAAFVISMSGWLFDQRGPERTAVENAERAVDTYLEAKNQEDAAELSSLRLTAASSIHRAWEMLAGAGAVRGGLVTKEAQGGRREKLVHRMLVAQQRWALADPDAHVLNENPAEWNTIPLASPSAWARLKRQWHLGSRPIVTALRVAIAGFLVSILSTVLGLGRPDWAITSVMLLLGQGPFRLAGTVRSFHRIAGSSMGILLYLAFYQLQPGLLMDLVGLTFAMFCTELLIAANYGLAMVFTAPLGLMMAGLGDTPVGQIAVDRGAEMAIASVLTVLMIWLVLPNNLQRTAEYNYEQLVASIKNLLAVYHERPLSESPTARRALRYELNESRATTLACAKESAEWRREQWGRHVAAHVTADDTLRAGAKAAHRGRTHVPGLLINRLQRRVGSLSS